MTCRAALILAVSVASCREPAPATAPSAPAAATAPSAPAAASAPSSAPAPAAASASAPAPAAASASAPAPAVASAPSSAPAPAASEPTADDFDVPETPKDGQRYALVVSFWSPGNGTDHEAAERLDAIVKAQPKKLARASGRWGKEGEHDECFALTELAPAAKGAFVARVKREVGTSKKVTIRENHPCRNERR